jgi:5-hydroxyisourate hydrolase-like protein (transthyretin family)
VLIPLLAVSLGLLGITGVGPVAAVPTASISGTVTVNSSPIAGVPVFAYDAQGSWVTGSATGADGSYTLTGLEPGEYRVVFVGSGTYLDQWYANKPTLAAADPITLASGEAATGKDASLVPAAGIAGTVTANGAPAEGIQVQIYDSNGDWAAGAATDALGHYSAGGLPAGSYRVEFNSAGRFVDQWYDNKPDRLSATPVVLVAGQTAGQTNATLLDVATISGTITAAGAALPNTPAAAYDELGNWVAGATSDQDGHYLITGLAAGTYRIQFSGLGTYFDQWYDNQPDRLSATPITLATGQAATGIDAAMLLAPAPRIADVTLTGTPWLGHTLTVAALGVTGTPTPTVTYRWQSATTAAGPWVDLPGANSTNYSPTPTDVGRVLRALVSATNGVLPDAISATRASAAVAGLPEAPTDLRAQPGDRSATLAFRPGPDGGEPVLNYEYLIDGVPGWTAFSPARTQPPVTVGGLVNGVRYTMRVRAISAVGPGAASGPVPVTPFATCALRVQARGAALPIRRPGLTVLVQAASTNPECRLAIRTSGGATGPRGSLPSAARFTIDRRTGRVAVVTTGRGRISARVTISSLPSRPGYRPSPSWQRTWSSR